jgi:hypothetical protein
MIEVVCSGCSWVINVSRITDNSVCGWCYEQLTEMDKVNA